MTTGYGDSKHMLGERTILCPIMLRVLHGKMSAIILEVKLRKLLKPSDISY